MDTPKDLPLWTQPPHLKHWLKETATFLEMYNRETSQTKLLQNENTSLMAERDQLVETLKTQEEKHNIAFFVLCKDKEKATKELEERVKKTETEMEVKVKEMTKEKDILAKELEEKMKKDQSVMQAEMKEIMDQLLHSRSEYVKLHAKFTTMAEMVKKYKAFHEQMNTALQNVT